MSDCQLKENQEYLTEWTNKLREETRSLKHELFELLDRETVYTPTEYDRSKEVLEMILNNIGNIGSNFKEIKKIERKLDLKNRKLTSTEKSDLIKSVLEFAKERGVGDSKNSFVNDTIHIITNNEFPQYFELRASEYPTNQYLKLSLWCREIISKLEYDKTRFNPKFDHKYINFLARVQTLTYSKY